MKYQIGEVVRFSEDAPYSDAFRLSGCLATITDVKQYGNYGDGTLAPGPVYKTAITGDTWVHQDYLVQVNGGMKPAEASASDSPLTYQLGEVIRFTNAGKLNGKLATIIAVNHDDPETYQTAITACDEWFIAKAFEPVNGGMPKPAKESNSIFERIIKEHGDNLDDFLWSSDQSTSDFTGDETDFETVTRLISDLDSCDYDCLIDWLRDETDRRNNAEHDTLLVDLGVALNRCLDSKLFSFLEQESLNELSKIYENDLDPNVRE